MFSTGTLLRALFKYGLAATLTIATLAGCGLVDNTLKGTLGTPGFFSVESGSELIVIPEGNTAHISFTLSDASPEEVLSEWEIVGGAGEFSLHEGTITISKGATLAQLPAITALTDTKLDGNVNYTLVISSKRFKNKGKRLEITVRVTDETQPAALEFSSEPEHDFLATLVNTTRTDVITVTNSGDATAQDMVFTGLAAPFRYLGGSFPGTGGDCSTTLAGGQSCLLALEFAPTFANTFTGLLSVAYKDYKQARSHGLNLKGIAATVVAEISGEPANPSNATALNITVGGEDVTRYRYKVGPQALVDCSNAGGYLLEEVIADKIEDSIAGYSDGALKICVVGITDLGLQQPFESATAYTWTKDTLAPTLTSISINGGATYTNDPLVSLTITGGGADEMLITNSGDCTPDGDDEYETFNAAKSNWPLSASDGTKSVSVRLRDLAGNLSGCSTDDIVLDTTPPAAPLNVVLGATPYSLSQTPTISFDDAIDALSGTASHQIRLYNSADTSAPIVPWQSFTSGDDLSGLSLTEGEEYYFEVRGVDNAGNNGTIATSSSWIASGPVEVTIGGAPTGTNNTTVLAVEITGQPNITEYRSKVGVTGTVDCTDIAGYGAITDKDTDITTDIGTTGLNLPDGSITLCVIGSNDILWQPVSSPTTATWTKDTAPPHTLSLVINSGDGYTNDDEVGLTLSAVDAVEMYVTNDSTCASGGDWAAYATSVGTWPLGQTEATATVYVKFKDAYGNETDCSTYDSIVHDSQDPNPPNTIVLGTTPPSVTESPEITFTSGGDNGPAGVLKFQIQIHLESDDSVVAGGGWQDFTSGGSVSGLTWMTSLELLPLQI